MKAMGKMEVVKCKCNWGLGILGTALLTAGAFLLVRGFLYQTAAAALWTNWYALGFYFAGFLAWGFGKIFKDRAGACCPAHGMCCE